MYERILPLAPMRLPTLVRSILSSMNPSATKAKPEYAFRTVTKTGISAPPIAALVVQPLAKESAVLAARHPAATVTECGAYARK